jgi:tetratricopeptide (TPR) repeat protein
MRTVLFALVAMLVTSNAVAEDAPNPSGCADYAKNRTGSDADCDAAIAKETDPKAKSVMLFRRAYIEDAAGDFATYPKALADLDEAIKLWPDNTSALHERGYLFNEYGRWNEAQADLDRQISLHPDGAGGYRERALARFHLGDLRGVYDDNDREVFLAPSAAGYMARANASIWLGNFDAARRDIAEALKIAKGNEMQKVSNAAKKAGERLDLLTRTSGTGASSCEAAAKANDFKRANLIGDCTRAFLDATTQVDRAYALTSRSTAWLIAASDQDASTDDSIVAAGIDPSAGNLSNLGFAYIRSRHSTGATWVFDRSIALEPSFFNHAGRAIARFNIGDVEGAFQDAKKSFELKPNDIALTVLGDCFHAKEHNYDRAKTFWINAYRMGDRDDGLIARLKEAGVPIPPPDDPPEAKTP